MMYCLRNAFSLKTKWKVSKQISVEKIVQRHFRRGVEKSNCIKVAIVGSGSFGDPAALIVKTCDNFINLFNCGEGTFRLMYAKAHRFRFISNVFCTSNRWERIGGIPSLARAIYDRTSAFPVFHGPPELERYLPQFASLTDLEPELAVSEKNFNKDSFFEDYHIQVDFVNLNRADGLRPNEKPETVVAYVCRMRPRRGSMLLSKFTTLNIPIEHIKTFNEGQNVTMEDGTVHCAKDFYAPGFDGANFLVIDVPSTDYLADLERNELLNGHLNEINSQLGMEFVAHFTSSKLIETSMYQQFMRRINAKRHLAVNDLNLYSGLKHVHLMQNQFNQLDAGIHPQLCSKFNPERVTYTTADEIDVNDPLNIQLTTSGTRYIFPMSGRLSDKTQSSSVDGGEDESDSTSEDCESDPEIHNIDTTPVDRTNIFPKVVFFGTGSSFPGVTKSVTAILVHTTSNSSILLDCGEGTVGQICRFYGSQTEDVIRNIKALHITHMHGDHHMGVMELIRIRQKYMPENRPPLLLMAPLQPFKSLLEFYEEHFGNVTNEFTFIDNDDLISGLPDNFKSMVNVVDLKTCRVPHLDPSFAISLNMKIMPEQTHNFKLTFSGDTLPCDAMVELAQNSTLLIHEATLEDTLAASAASKKHSTISQAIEIGQRSQSQYTLLTHFSQRYRVLPPIDDELMKNKNIGLAFDNMEVIPNDLCKLNDLYFKLKEIYADELKRMQARSKKYALRNDY